MNICTILDPISKTFVPAFLVLVQLLLIICW